jgi:hypothetical protein
MKKKPIHAVRADPFKLDEPDDLNLSDFKPAAPRVLAASKEEIKALSETHNFRAGPPLPPKLYSLERPGNRPTRIIGGPVGMSS